MQPSVCGPTAAVHAPTLTRRPSSLLMVHAMLTLGVNVWLCGMTTQYKATPEALSLKFSQKTSDYTRAYTVHIYDNNNSNSFLTRHIQSTFCHSASVHGIRLCHHSLVAVSIICYFRPSHMFRRMLFSVSMCMWLVCRLAMYYAIVCVEFQCQCQPTRRTFRTTVDRRWPGIQCCRSTSMEQPTGSCHLGRKL